MLSNVVVPSLPGYTLERQTGGSPEWDVAAGTARAVGRP